MSHSAVGALALLLAAGPQGAPLDVQTRPAGLPSEIIVPLTTGQDAPGTFRFTAKIPYSTLFRSEPSRTLQIVPRGGQLETPEAPEVTFICGLKVFHVDARLDPHMVHNVPSFPAAKFAIRTLTPPVCR